MATERLPNAVHKLDRKLDSGVWEARLWMTDDLPDGTRIEGEPKDEWTLAWTLRQPERGIIRLDFEDFDTPGATNVWFVSVEEPKSDPPAQHLVAFVSDAFPHGTIVSRYTFISTGISNDDQAGAIRWYPDGGLVHQIYVAPEWRRHQLATRIMYTANAFHIAHDWNGKLHGDGRRTMLGEYLAVASAYPERFASLELEMPPMDEPE